MKNKVLLPVFILTQILIVSGALLKIQHYPYATYIMGLGLLMELFVFVVFIMKILKTKNDPFWNN